MRSMNLLQMAGGVAVAGVVAAGATAVTGSGVVWGGGATGSATQFVGGKVSQTVTGATVSSVVYAFADSAGAKVQTNSITITVANADGKSLTVSPSGGSGLGGTADEWTCTGTAAVYDATSTYDLTVTIPTGGVVVCTPSLASNHSVVGYWTGLTTLDLTVA
jgi:hypothetical protein